MTSMRVLSRYVKKNAFFAMTAAIIGLWALQIVFSYLAELDRISDTYSYTQAIQYIAYRSPYFLEQFIPSGALLGAVIGLGLLANKSELVVMRASGISIYRIVSWVLQPALLFVLLSLVINQFVLPTTNQLARQISEPNAAPLASVSGYWTVQNSPSQTDSQPAGNEIVFIDYADVNGNIKTVKRWRLDDNNNLTFVSKATHGKYLANTQPSESANITGDAFYQWQLQNLTNLVLTPQSHANQPQQNEQQSNQQSFVYNDKPMAVQQQESSDIISLPIAPSYIYLLTRSANDLSLTQLYDYYQLSLHQGTRSLEHELKFWQKLLSPFSVLSLVIVACSFVFGSLRTHSLGLRIVVAVIFGLLFTYIQDLVGFISLATGVSPLLMVVLPIVGSAALGLYLIKRQM